ELTNNNVRLGKVRILSGGDAMRSHFAARQVLAARPIRDSSYVRVCTAEHSNTILLVNYGRLEKILVCSLPDSRLWRNFAGKTVTVALVTPCQTHSKDATRELTTYSRTLATIATDLRNIKAVVGRCKTRGDWVIVDRSGAYVQPLFEEVDSGDEDEEVD
ncbi:hypothetical protein BU15DRAFT_55996, partial [Melanogaster broomeanus]